MTSIHIRAAEADDAATIARILRASRVQAMPWMPHRHSTAEDLWFVRNRILARCRVSVASISGNVIGFLAVADDWIEHLYISPEHWRRGTGAALLKRAKEEATRLQLWTFTRNQSARLFYESHGFTAVEHTDGSQNEEGEPDTRYVWTGDEAILGR